MLFPQVGNGFKCDAFTANSLGKGLKSLCLTKHYDMKVYGGMDA
jgi:hypothetical protein